MSARVGDIVQIGDKQGVILDRVRSRGAFFVAVAHGGEEINADHIMLPFDEAEVVMTKGEARRMGVKWWRLNG